MTSLYVGDLDVNVMDHQLYDLFSQVGRVVSVKVCRHCATRRSLGFGFVDYDSPFDAAKALNALNFTPLNGKPIRIMYRQMDFSARNSGFANIFIKNLGKGFDQKALHDIFSSFGNILSCKVATDPSGQSKGYAFVQYDKDEAAKKAIGEMNGTMLDNNKVYVGPFIPKRDRSPTNEITKFNNVYVKNLVESTSEEDLQKIFGEFGQTTSIVVMRDADGKSKCFGFVNFANPNDAARSVESLNGKKFEEKKWYVGKAQRKFERESELKLLFEVSNNIQGTNLYIKHLDDGIDDDRLKELFSPFGTVTSCKVVRLPNGVSRGFGFVAFSTTDEANRAIEELNRKIVVNKPLYVAHAQRKEDRRALLQAQFSQIRRVVIPHVIAPRMPLDPPRGRDLSGTRPGAGAALMTNSVIPMVPSVMVS